LQIPFGTYRQELNASKLKKSFEKKKDLSAHEVGNEVGCTQPEIIEGGGAEDPCTEPHDSAQNFAQGVRQIVVLVGDNKGLRECDLGLFRSHIYRHRPFFTKIGLFPHGYMVHDDKGLRECDLGPFGHLFTYILFLQRHSPAAPYS